MRVNVARHEPYGAVQNVSKRPPWSPNHAGLGVPSQTPLPWARRNGASLASFEAVSHRSQTGEGRNGGQEARDAKRAQVGSAGVGHIGYDTVPSARGRGVATEMVRQALPVARALGLREVLVTCDDTNAASIRVIEKNGGQLRETKAFAPSRPLKRHYWIALFNES